MLAASQTTTSQSPQRKTREGLDQHLLYIVSVIDGKTNTGGEASRTVIDEFNERSAVCRPVEFAGGLVDPYLATVIDNRGGSPSTSKRTLVQTNEYLAGVWIWEVPDLETALALATEASQICDRKIEIRQFH